MRAHYRREEAKQWKSVTISLRSWEQAKGEEMVTNIAYTAFALCDGIPGTIKRENTRPVGRKTSKAIKIRLKLVN
jgi:hypothetical protein